MLNNHAHMEFVTLDERGINRQRDFGKFVDGKKVLCTMQDDVAKLLNMERGVSVKKSKTKRIEPRVLAKMKEEEIKRRKKLIERLNQILIDERKVKQKENLEFQNKIATLNEQNLEFQKYIKTLKEEQNAKQNLSKEEIKRIRIIEQNRLMNYLINKLDDINESDYEVYRFMFRGDEDNKLVAKLFNIIRDLMKAHARNELNEANRQRHALNDAYNLIAKLKTDIDRSKPNREYKEQIVLLLKRFNHKAIARILGFKEIYDLRKLDDYSAKSNIATLGRTLEFLRDTCLNVARQYENLAKMWNNAHENKVSYLQDDEAIEIISEMHEDNSDEQRPNKQKNKILRRAHAM